MRGRQEDEKKKTQEKKERRKESKELDCQGEKERREHMNKKESVVGKDLKGGKED